MRRGMHLSSTSTPRGADITIAWDPHGAGGALWIMALPIFHLDGLPVWLGSAHRSLPESQQSPAEALTQVQPAEPNAGDASY